MKSISPDLSVPVLPNPPRTVVSASKTYVHELMTRRVITVTPDTSIEGVAELMLSEGLSRIPVVDKLGRPIGMVAKTDLIEDQYDGEGGELPPTAMGRYPLENLVPRQIRTVRDVMTHSIVSIELGCSIRDAARAMSLQNLHGLPVVDHAGTLVGVISALDIVGWVAHEG